MSFDNNSFYDDNSTKNWQPQPTPMEDRRRRHTGKWITAIVIVGMLALAVTGTVHLVRDVGVTLNRSDNGFLLTIGTQPAQQSSAPAEQTQTTKEEAVHAEAPAQTQQAAEDLPQLTIVQSPAGIPTVASDEDGALSLHCDRHTVRQSQRDWHHHVGGRICHHEPSCDRKRAGRERPDV